MWRDLSISEQEWIATLPAVRTVLLALQQQVRLMGIRFTAYEKQLAAFREQVATPLARCLVRDGRRWQ